MSEAAAKAADMKVKLKFLDEEAEQKLRLDRLQTRKELEMAEAKLQVFGQDIKQETESASEYKTVLDHPVNSALNRKAPEFVPKFVATQLAPLDRRHVDSDHGVSEASSQLQELAQVFAEQVTISRFPPPEPVIFTGEVIEYPSWRAAFDILVDRKGIPAGEKIYYLKKYLGGAAREAVEGYMLLPTEEAYNSAKELLHSRYGNPFVIASAFRDKLENWKEIGDKDGKGLRKYSDFLQQCAMAKRNNHSLSVLDDERENNRLMSKLPEWLSHKWARRVAEWRERLQRFPPFLEFTNFLVKESNIMCDPVTSVSRKNSESKKSESKKKNEAKNDSARTLSTDVVEKESSKSASACPKCNGRHNLNSCRSFLATPIEERKEFVRDRYLCFGCLKSGHRSRVCRNRSTCNTCSKRHPTSLHDDFVGREQATEAKKVQATETKKVHAGMSSCSKSSLLSKSSMIIPVWLSHQEEPNNEVLVYAMLDTQSDTTFVLSSVCDTLKVEGQPVNLLLSTLSAQDEAVESTKVRGLVVRGFNSDVQVPLPASYTRNIMPVDRSHIPTPETAMAWPHLQSIAHKLMPLGECEVAVLIGYNCPRALLPREVIPPAEDGPYAQRTDLGWGIVGIAGPIDKLDDPIGVSHRVLAREGSSSMNELGRARIVLQTSIKEKISPSDVTRMLELDFSERETGEETMSQDDMKFVKIISEGIHLNPEHHYEMPLPLKESDVPLPNNRPLAVSRLVGLRKRMLKDPKFQKEYTTFIQNMLDKGYAEKVPESDLVPDKGSVWYVPHHGVYHPKKPDKLRVVFDCSAKYQGQSLNGRLLQGPDYINGLVGVLCRFRQETVAITCDVEAMFHQFSVNPEHRDLLRFLWWEDGNLATSPTEHRMKSHIFGAVSSPACANYGLKQLASDNEAQFGTEAAQFIRRGFYVDDGIKSIPIPKQAIKLLYNVMAMCDQGGLRLHRIASNSQEVLDAIPPEDRGSGTGLQDLLEGTPIPERVLGVHWCLESDTLSFRVVLKDQPLTRRGVLSTVSSLYDPLGLAAPVVLLGKQILQEMCSASLDWDDPLPDSLRPRWEQWREDLLLLEGFKVPRCFKPAHFGKIVTAELHHFADASSRAYGTCSYLRLVDDESRVHCTLVLGKSRVAPRKPVTIPRLELTAAVVAVKMSVLAQRELEYEQLQHRFWSDSRVVLGYINNDASRFHVFVANRLQVIHDHSKPDQWQHVTTQSNVADVASRGCTAAELISHPTWLRGPEFLWSRQVPEPEPVQDVSLDDPEVRGLVLSSRTTGTAVLECSRLAHLSSWSHAKRTIASILHLKARLQGQKKSQSTTVDDLHHAELEIIRMVQHENFHKEITTLTSQHKSLGRSSALRRLDPFVDKDGVLRVGGRLRVSEIENFLKHPAILPKRHHITELVVRHFHEKTQHQGRGMTMNEIRGNGYWIIGGTSVVKRLILGCVLCRKLRGSVTEQVMSDLPADRLHPAPPFTYSAVDLFGPFYIKEGRKEMKRYGVLFTCMACRAVHVETTTSLETDSFINSLRRFLALRGTIRQLRCDRGTNFVGAARELRQATQEMDKDKLQSTLLTQECDYFHFEMNVPAASHMGGVWERQIRTVRSVLNSILTQSGTQLDDDSLRTFMYEAAAIVNSRPLSVETMNDPTLSPITPNHLLTMKSNVLLPPPGEFMKADLYSRKRWRRVQYMADQFWGRWKREFLSTLQTRQKWNTPRREMKVGDVVIVKDDNLSRCQWQLARVDEVLPSKDGHIRKVKIILGDRCLTPKGKRAKPASYLERPVQKLVLLCHE